MSPQGISEAMVKSYANASAQAAATATQPAVGDRLTVSLDPDSGNPLAALSPGAVGAVSTDYYGAFSVEKFAAASDLFYTHEDAQGWLNYVQQFQAANFWYKDAGVAPWAYYEQYDNWQDTYGLDAVMAAYHSGHGAMDGNGVFYAAMGSNWGGLGTNALSSSMAIGNEQVRYLFWSTCFSCRVLGGHNPIRTWNAPNLGFRMLFGYETTSIDAGNYGSDFWKQWNRNKSFSQAFLDMSWYDVSTHQAPAVTACGATAAEAQDRLYNERFFNWGAVSRNYWHWRWYYAAASALATRALNQRVPPRIAAAQLAVEPASPRLVRGILNRVPVGVNVPGDIAANPMGVIVIADANRHIAIDRNGTYEAQLAAPNLESRNEPQIGAAIRRAQEVVRQFGLDRNDIVFDRVLHKYDCAGSSQGSGSIETPRLCETVVQFTQLIDGIPVIGPGEGKVTVTLDNDQNVTAIVDRTRTIAKVAEALSAPVPPEAARPTDSARIPQSAPTPASSETDPQQLLSARWQERMKSWVVSGRMPERHAVVPGSFEVGYIIRGNMATLVARQEVEADCGGGFLKRFVVETPIQG
jgi:hypothetical protein